MAGVTGVLLTLESDLEIVVIVVFGCEVSHDFRPSLISTILWSKLSVEQFLFSVSSAT
jgi:hypothetical protein